MVLWSVIAMEKLSEYEATSLQALFDIYDTEGEVQMTFILLVDAHMILILDLRVTFNMISTDARFKTQNLCLYIIYFSLGLSSGSVIIATTGVHHHC